MVKKISILLVDDHDLVRNAIKGYFKKDEKFEIIGEAENGETALEMVKDLQPDMVITDISMPKKDGFWLTEKIKKRWPEIKIVILTMQDDFSHIKKSLQVKADGFLLKSSDEDEVKRTVIDIAEGVDHFNEEVSKIVMEHLSKSELMKLSDDIKSTTSEQGKKMLKMTRHLGLIIIVEVIVTILLGLVF